MRRPAASLLGLLVGISVGGCGVEPPVPAALVMVGGDGQTVAAGEMAPLPLVAEVRDRRGRPFAGAKVVFSVVGGGGSVSTTAVNTGGDGRASTTWRVGITAGAANSVEANVFRLAPVAFTSTVVAGPVDRVRVHAATLVVDSGATAIDSSDAMDRYDNPVSRNSISWAVRSTTVAALATAGPGVVTVTGRTRGQTTLVASSGSVADSAVVVVVIPGGVAAGVDLPFELKADTSLTAPLRVIIAKTGLTLGSGVGRISWDPRVVSYTGSSGTTFGSAFVNADSAAQGVLLVSFANGSGTAGVVDVVKLRLKASSQTGVIGTVTVSFGEISTGSFQNLGSLITPITRSVRTR